MSTMVADRPPNSQDLPAIGQELMFAAVHDVGKRPVPRLCIAPATTD
jgi:hypothetical protein